MTKPCRPVSEVSLKTIKDLICSKLDKMKNIAYLNSASIEKTVPYFRFSQNLPVRQMS